MHHSAHFQLTFFFLNKERVQGDGIKPVSSCLENTQYIQTHTWSAMHLVKVVPLHHHLLFQQPIIWFIDQYLLESFCIPLSFLHKFRAMNRLLLGLATLLLLIQQACSMSTIIKPGEVQCYHEELEVGEKITVSYQVCLNGRRSTLAWPNHSYFLGCYNYQVGDGGNLDIDFWVNHCKSKLDPLFWFPDIM